MRPVPRRVARMGSRRRYCPLNPSPGKERHQAAHLTTAGIPGDQEATPWQYPAPTFASARH
jgi:hypothetical protein